jgi:methionyl-tRNA synthetase
MTKKFYITTPIYYINAAPHIGHAYTTLAADIIKRYKQSKGIETYFLTGTDEHGGNIEKTAKKAGVEPQKWADDIVTKYKELWKNLNIDYDDFIRTTEPRHEKPVRLVFEWLIKSGDIYLGKYKGWYCTPCENYWDIKDAPEKKCPVHDTALEEIEEETYFFKLSKYEKPLLKFYEENPDFLAPKMRSAEILRFVESGLKDISVSRTKVSWGIKVKSNPKHIIYVWFDALHNYVTAVGLENILEGKPSEQFASIWPADIHLVGKEIYRFHAVIWPAILMALKLPLPKQVFAHGWWTVDGDKMSKSKGNFINPVDITAKYGLDALRYFMFREVPFGADGDFSTNSFKQRYIADLANDLGNLLSRTTNMVVKFLGGKITEKNFTFDYGLISKTEQFAKDADTYMEKLQFDKALEKIWAVFSLLNKSIDEHKPWAMAKESPEKLKDFLSQAIICLKKAAVLIQPFMPETAEKIKTQLGAGRQGLITKGDPLFPRIEE